MKIAERVQLNEIPLPAAPEEAGTPVCVFILSYCGYTSGIYADGFIVSSFHFCFMGIFAAIYLWTAEHDYMRIMYTGQSR